MLGYIFRLCELIETSAPLNLQTAATQFQRALGPCIAISASAMCALKWQIADLSANHVGRSNTTTDSPWGSNKNGRGANHNFFEAANLAAETPHVQYLCMFRGVKRGRVG